MSGIALSNAVRQNLLTLQDTASMMSMTQNRLATGNKVNTAVDNPNSYFTAQGLNNRASDLSTLQDSMSLAVQTVNAASQGIDGITKLVAQAKSIANQALQTTVTAASTTSAVVATDYSTAANSGQTLVFKVGDNASTSITLSTNVTSAGVLKAAISGQVSGLTVAVEDGKIKFSVASGDNFTVSGTAVGTAIATNVSTSNGANRDKFQTQYNDLLKQINQLSDDASFNGVNLLKSGTTLTVNFNESQSSKLDIAGVKLDSSGLGLTDVSAWATDSNISSTISSLDKATTTLRNQSSTFGSNLAVVQNRQTFTDNMINTLQTGAANLTLADTNQEGANLLALQTRQSLATTALSLSNQAQSSILSILR